MARDIPLMPGIVSMADRFFESERDRLETQYETGRRKKIADEREAKRDHHMKVIGRKGRRKIEKKDSYESRIRNLMAARNA